MTLVTFFIRIHFKGTTHVVIAMVCFVPFFVLWASDLMLLRTTTPLADKVVREQPLFKSCVVAFVLIFVNLMHFAAEPGLAQTAWRFNRKVKNAHIIELLVAIAFILFVVCVERAPLACDQSSKNITAFTFLILGGGCLIPFGELEHVPRYYSIIILPWPPIGRGSAFRQR